MVETPVTRLGPGYIMHQCDLLYDLEMDKNDKEISPCDHLLGAYMLLKDASDSALVLRKGRLYHLDIEEDNCCCSCHRHPKFLNSCWITAIFLFPQDLFSSTICGNLL